MKWFVNLFNNLNVCQLLDLTDCEIFGFHFVSFVRCHLDWVFSYDLSIISVVPCCKQLVFGQSTAASTTLKDLNYFKCLRVWLRACAPVTQVVAISEQMPAPPGWNQRFSGLLPAPPQPKGTNQTLATNQALAAAPQNATVE